MMGGKASPRLLAEPAQSEVEGPGAFAVFEICIG